MDEEDRPLTNNTNKGDCQSAPSDADKASGIDDKTQEDSEETQPVCDRTHGDKSHDDHDDDNPQMLPKSNTHGGDCQSAPSGDADKATGIDGKIQDSEETQPECDRTHDDKSHDDTDDDTPLMQQTQETEWRMKMKAQFQRLLEEGKALPDFAKGTLPWPVRETIREEALIGHLKKDMQMGKPIPDSSQGEVSWTLDGELSEFKNRLIEAYDDNEHYGVVREKTMEVNEIFKNNKDIEYTPMLSGSLVDGTILCLIRRPKFDFDIMYCYNRALIPPSSIHPISKDKCVYVHLIPQTCQELEDFRAKVDGLSYISAGKVKASLSHSSQKLMEFLRPGKQAEIDKYCRPNEAAVCITFRDIVEFITDDKLIDFKLWDNDKLAEGAYKVTRPILSKVFDIEIVPALICKTWPESNFFSRSRPQNWPDPEVLRKLKANTKVHFVPKFHLGGNDDMEWRYSFSEAENLMSQHMTRFQRRCFATLKNMVHDLANNVKQSPSKTEHIICTYHVKTVIYWSIEQDLLLWQEEDLGRAVESLLRRLVTYVSTRNLPHYFMPKYNLFSDITEEQWENLLVDKNTGSYSWIWKPSTPMQMLPKLYTVMLKTLDPRQRWRTQLTPRLNNIWGIGMELGLKALQDPQSVNTIEYTHDLFEKVWDCLKLENTQFTGTVAQAIARCFYLLAESLFRGFNMMKGISDKEQKAVFSHNVIPAGDK